MADQAKIIFSNWMINFLNEDNLVYYSSWTLKKVLLTQVHGTKDDSETNRDYVLTNGLGIGEDLHVPVNLQLSQPQQHYKAPSGTAKLGYDLSII